LAKKYKIEYDPNHIVPMDDEQLDNVFKAAYELVLDVGILCQDTERLIKFKPEELQETFDNMPQELVLGLGEEAIRLSHKGFEDYDNQRNPHFVQGRILGPISPEVYTSISMSYLKEPIMDMNHFQGVIGRVNGVDVKPNSPFEMLSEMERVALVRDACRRAGRPGFSDGGTMPTGYRSQIVADHPGWGTTIGDQRCTNLMPQMKTNYEYMCKALEMYQYGAHTWGGSIAYIGSLSGGPATSAIQVCADNIATDLVYQLSLHGSWALDALYFSNSSRTALFASLWGGAAYLKHVNHPAYIGPSWQQTAKLGKEYFWEHVAGAIGSSVLGMGVCGGTGAQSAGPDCACGLGVRLAGEVGQAVGRARLTRKQANDLVLKILEKYQPMIDSRTLHTIGVNYQDAYDVESATPKPEFLEIYNEVKKELVEMGLPMRVFD
jgi:methylamine--corrinoid protein Co-methyltransferase